jgi:hypothetical protein
LAAIDPVRFIDGADACIERLRVATKRNRPKHSYKGKRFRIEGPMPAHIGSAEAFNSRAY